MCCLVYDRNLLLRGCAKQTVASLVIHNKIYHSGLLGEVSKDIDSMDCCDKPKGKSCNDGACF